MTSVRFAYLLGLYKSDRLSATQWQEFRQAILTGKYNDLLQDDILKALQDEVIHPLWDRSLEASMWEHIRDQVNSGMEGDRNTNASALSGELMHVEGSVPATGSVPVEIRPFLLRPVSRITAVAAALLAVALALWLLIPGHHQARVPAPLAVVNNNVPPGSDKAVLTLADGTRILLDSARDGLIARQGASRIVKINGALAVTPVTKDNTEAVQFNTISTPRGGQFEVDLPDGSKVWLNSASSLKFPTAFSGQRRSVELTGEAYFEIGKNVQMPFVVHVNNYLTGQDGENIKVLGTSFNVMAYADESTINTTLLQGAVEVSGSDQAKRLSPGEQAVFNASERKMSVRQADLQQVMAWKNGLFEFENTGITAIMRQLARWYDIEVIYQVKPDNSPLGGSISRNLTLKEVLALLEANGINHFKLEGKKVFVMP